MIKFEVTTDIEASPLECFDLSRDLDFHQDSFKDSDESIVGGRSSGLIELNEEVIWRAKHLGFYHRHTSKITAFDSPHHFRDEMIEGRFARYLHDHYFEQIPTGTRMRDVVEFQAPLGILGLVAEVLVLKNYMRRLILDRSLSVRAKAEAISDSSGLE
ncbi:MAG: SRPBCC family protein [Planctomycetes bacterium]|nr:SRPBCC family protein [Planctomycetota bacterium]